VGYGDFTGVEAINNSRVIVGRAMDMNQMMHAVMWQNGQITSLRAGNDTFALDINNASQIVGYGGGYGSLPMHFFGTTV